MFVNYLPFICGFPMVYDGKSIKWIQMDDGLEALVLHIAQREVQIATERHLGVERKGPWGLDQSENVEEIRSYRNGSYRGII